MAPLESQELQKLVSKAVEQALKQRKLTDAELRQILHGPITIGLLATPQQLGSEIQQSPGPVAIPGIHDKHRLIGFIAPNIENIETALKGK